MLENYQVRHLIFYRNKHIHVSCNMTIDFWLRLFYIDPYFEKLFLYQAIQQYCIKRTKIMLQKLYYNDLLQQI